MGRRAELLRLRDFESADRARRLLLECSDALDDGLHVTLVEDLRDIAAALADMQAEVRRLIASEQKAWAERNVAYAKVKAWESTVYVENLPLRLVRVDDWGPGEGKTTTVPEVTPLKLTALLDELRVLREENTRMKVRQPIP